MGHQGPEILSDTVKKILKELQLNNKLILGLSLKKLQYFFRKQKKLL